MRISIIYIRFSYILVASITITAGAAALLAFFAPVIQTVFLYPSGEGIYSLLHNICHQFPSRSLWITDRPFALCSRCFSGYVGLFSGGAYFLFSKNKIKPLLMLFLGAFFILPGVLDGFVQALTAYTSTNFTRSFTGIFGGIGISMVISSVLSTGGDRNRG